MLDIQDWNAMFMFVNKKQLSVSQAIIVYVSKGDRFIKSHHKLTLYRQNKGAR